MKSGSCRPTGCAFRASWSGCSAAIRPSFQRFGLPCSRQKVRAPLPCAAARLLALVFLLRCAAIGWEDIYDAWLIRLWAAIGAAVDLDHRGGIGCSRIRRRGRTDVVGD